MKNNNRIAKLYEGLSSHELAALCFESAIKLDELEMQRIVDAVPKYTYTMPDSAYVRRLDGINAFSLMWGASHWRAYCGRMAANVLLLFADRSTEERQQSLADLLFSESRLLALENVLLTICEKYGINPDMVRAYTNAMPFSSKDENLVPDMDYQAEVQGSFERLLSGDEGGTR